MDNKHLDELHKKRNSWVQSTKDNNFDGGIYNLLTELYPDNAHFIYELLQNAEDANASEISFKLSKSSLSVVHNGRPFNSQDIEGITSIGQGTKANDVNKIGKFGVGFKAVFSYTSTPQIFSGDFNFEIKDLVVPNEIDCPYEMKGKTKMIFPFNNLDKSKEQAYSEIKQAMEHLQDNTLLFLDSICKINYQDTSFSNSIERINDSDIKVKISNQRANTFSEWLRFKKYLPDSKKLFVSVAYNLSRDLKSKQEMIVPINGEVSIFFLQRKKLVI